MLVEITTSNTIRVKGLSKEMTDHFKKHLTIPNPMYFKLMRASGQRARAFYGTPKEFKYYKEEGDTLTLPRGMRDLLKDFLLRMGIPMTETELLVSIPLPL